jgi:hypothetical protein
MPIAVIVDGPCNIKVGTGAVSALEQLGFSINGVTIQEQTFMANVPGDQNGGDEGPPIDIQYFGDIHRVTTEMSKWDNAVVDKIRARLNALGVVAAGVSPTQVVGSLIAGGSFGYRLLLEPVSRPRNYILAIPREPIEINKGTKFSRLVIQWECHASAGTLYNATTT